MALKHDELKRLLRYDPATGKWFNRIWRGGSAYPGTETGRPNSDGYIQICVKGVRYMSSRLAFFYMKGRWPEAEMDHRDRNRKNNRWKNLRPANDSQQQMNRAVQRNNVTGHTGVVRSRRKGYWSAFIAKDHKRTWLGRFRRKRDAIVARQQAEQRLFGKFRRVA